MNSDKPLYIAYAGPMLLETPLLNKGSAFTEDERRSFNLMGLLPPRYENIDEQVERAYLQYCSFDEPINKHIYLRAVQDNNETLFYRLLNDHLEEMLPIIYTPTVGEACEHFSDIYRSARGIFVSYEDRDYMDDILHSVSKDRVKVLVVTDGERVLGLGDQGIGGMGIPIGKLSLYTACGGISPAYTLPVVLDVGTNNQTLLDDPMYMGMRHSRIGREEYDAFVDQFIEAAQRRWPGVLIQFEDFAQPNAMPILQRHKDNVCCFNDDIQGTAAVTLGTVLSACQRKGERLRDQNIVFVGAGSAGCGIAEQLIRAMVEEGLSDAEARSQLYMVDRFGLVSQGMDGLLDFQAALAQPAAVYSQWRCGAGDYPSLLDVVSNVDVGVLIGVSGKPGLFTEEVIRQLHSRCAQPIVLPLSNPSRHVEARPEQILQWTDGQAIVATGSPFAAVDYAGERYEISQCNNSYIFPGIGLGVVASKASRVSDEMLMAASRCLGEAASAHHQRRNVLLPPLTELAALSKAIAFAVASVAMAQGLAVERSDEELRADIERNFWTPQYREYRRIAARAR